MIRTLRSIYYIIDGMPSHEADDIIYSYWCPFITALVNWTLAVCIVPVVYYVTVGTTGFMGFVIALWAYLLLLTIWVVVGLGIFVITKPDNWNFKLPEPDRR